MGQPLNGGVINRRVGGNHRVHAVAHNVVHGAQDGIVIEVGRKLHGDGLVGQTLRFHDLFTLGLKGLEQFAQGFVALERPQILGVGA